MGILRKGGLFAKWITFYCKSAVVLMLGLLTVQFLYHVGILHQVSGPAELLYVELFDFFLTGLMDNSKCICQWNARRCKHTLLN